MGYPDDRRAVRVDQGLGRESWRMASRDCGLLAEGAAMTIPGGRPNLTLKGGDSEPSRPQGDQEHIGRLEAMERGRREQAKMHSCDIQGQLHRDSAESIAWALRTIREQAARIADAELEALNTQAVESMKT